MPLCNTTGQMMNNFTQNQYDKTKGSVEELLARVQQRQNEKEK